jgi:hypothetical protein
MKTKTTLILLGLVVAVAVWIKYFESKGPNTEEVKRRGQNVLNFERENLEGILIQNGDDRVELRKTNDRWRLEEPIKDQARSRGDRQSDFGPGELGEGLETFPAKEIEADKNRLTEYDLVKPKLRLKLLGKEMPPEISSAKMAHSRVRMYVRFDNAKDTFVVRQTGEDRHRQKTGRVSRSQLTEITQGQVRELC